MSNESEEIQVLRKEMAYLRAKVLNLAKLAVTTGVESSNNDSQFPVFQVEYMGKTADVALIFPYGQFASLPKGQLLVVQSIGAEESNRVALGSGDPSDRPEIDEGEVIYFHPQTGATIHFKNSGEIEIKSTKGQDINIVGDGQINLGVGGPAIARLGDTVSVSVVGVTLGGATLPASGTITSGGNNTST